MEQHCSACGEKGLAGRMGCREAVMRLLRTHMQLNRERNIVWKDIPSLLPRRERAPAFGPLATISSGDALVNTR